MKKSPHQHLDFPLAGAGPAVRLAHCHGFKTFSELAEAVALLPYGRISDSSDITAILKEGKGTCSSKHRFLATVAGECGHADVDLMVGLYEMSEENTPGIAAGLGDIKSIPEAHCYLMHRGARLDFTGLPNGISSPFDALIEEHIVLPSELPSIKNTLHRCVINDWALARGMAPDQVWKIRERCIELLANNSILRTPDGAADQ